MLKLCQLFWSEKNVWHFVNTDPMSFDFFWKKSPKGWVFNKQPMDQPLNDLRKATIHRRLLRARWWAPNFFTPVGGLYIWYIEVTEIKW